MLNELYKPIGYEISVKYNVPKPIYFTYHFEGLPANSFKNCSILPLKISVFME